MTFELTVSKAKLQLNAGDSVLATIKAAGVCHSPNPCLCVDMGGITLHVLLCGL